MTKPRNPDQVELDRWASRRRWNRGPFKSWSLNGFTVARSSRGVYIVVERATAKRTQVRTLAELDGVITEASRVAG